MLVLSRKQGEEVKIGDHITVTVLGIRGGVVKLGIDAPPHVRILRGELSDWVGSDWKEKEDPQESHPEQAVAV
jgi:carbon storage regulator